MIKMIASDIDGTLVKEASPCLPEEMTEVINRLVDKGIVFAAVSGRSNISVERFLGTLKERVYCIGCNGCVTKSNGKVLFVEELDPAMRSEMIQELRKTEGVVPYLTSATQMYDEGSLPEVTKWLRENYREEVTIVDDLTKVTDQCVKLSVYDTHHNPRETFKTFMEKWKDRAMVAVSGAVWMDVCKPGTGKGKAVGNLQSALHILPSETLAMGDQQNDISLLHAAEYSYAIGDALPDVKKEAKYVMDTLENKGSLKVLRKVLAELEENI